jgi:hypothetical protein
LTALHQQAQAAIRQLASERPSRPPTAQETQAAAALLADLWAAAARHGITPGTPGWARHLPRAALDATVAAGRPKRGGHKPKPKGAEDGAR